jgi:hypothetical protein
LKRASGLLALLCIAILALMAGQPYFTNASKPPRGISSPIIALEMVRSVQEVDYILSNVPSPDREVMRIKQYIGFALTGSLTALFLILGWMLMQQGGVGRMGGPAAMVCALGAAAFDVLQKLAILRLVDVGLLETSQSMLNAIRSASMGAWTLTAFTLALLSGLYFRGDALRRATGAIALLTAAMELYGLHDNRFLAWQVYPAMIGLALIAVPLIRRRARSSVPDGDTRDK